LLLGERERAYLTAGAPLGRDAVALLTDLHPELAVGPDLGDLGHELDAGVDEEGDAIHDARERVGGQGGADRLEDEDRVADRVADLFRRRRARFHVVVAAAVHRVPRRCLGGGELDEVGRESERDVRVVDRRAARHELLQQIVLGGAAELLSRDAAAVGDGDVERVQPDGRRVDRHRGVDGAEVDLLEEGLHVAEVGDRDAGAADLALRHGMVGVVAILGRQIERDGQAALTLGQVLAIASIRLLGVAETGVRTNDPGGARLGLGHGETSAGRDSGAASAGAQVEARAGRSDRPLAVGRTTRSAGQAL